MHRPTTALPTTYVHDGGWFPGKDTGSFLDLLRPAPPDWYHCTSLATPIPNSYGAVLPSDEEPNRLAPPEEIADRLAEIRRWTDALHEIGVGRAIVYTCNQKLGGHAGERTGAWTFYDHWADYEPLGIGPKPALDPEDWQAREPDGALHLNYELRHTAFTQYGMYCYSPCENNPGFDAYLRANIRMIGMAGYDGVFVDNNNLNCYCAHCQEKFRAWMTARWTPDELRARFDWTSPDEIALAERGNRFRWVLTDPLFREFVGLTVPPEERVRWFGTDDMATAPIADAGNGWLWGRGNEYLRWAYARYSLRERERRWGTPRLEGNWGMRDARDRERWAETKRFWAAAIRANHSRIRRWGMEGSGRDFLVVPNWGNLQQYEDIGFREPIGHTVREWTMPDLPPSFPSTGGPESDRPCDLIFWEDDGEPGRVAPGVYFGFAFEYRLAFAHDTRSATMANLPGDRATANLAHAEAAATGGSAFIQRGLEFPELRATYMRMFADHPDWFAGYHSCAPVGIAFSFDNLHREHIAHPRAAYRLMHWLDDQQAPHDPLPDDALADPDLLAGYRAVFLPDLRYVASEAYNALSAYAEAGGTLVVAGEWAPYDLRGARRGRHVIDGLLAEAPETDGIRVLGIGRGRMIAGPLDALLPATGLSREDAVEIANAFFRAINRTVSRHTMYRNIDYGVPLERHLEPGPLGALIPGWADTRVADPYAAIGLRAFPYVRPGETIIVHLVNYNLDLAAPAGTRSNEPLRDVAIRVLLPDGATASRAEWLVPGAAPAELPATVERGAARVIVPEVAPYAIVRVAIGRA